MSYIWVNTVQVKDWQQFSCGDTAAVFPNFQNKMDMNALPFNGLAIRHLEKQYLETTGEEATKTTEPTSVYLSETIPHGHKGVYCIYLNKDDNYSLNHWKICVFSLSLISL